DSWRDEDLFSLFCSSTNYKSKFVGSIAGRAIRSNGLQIYAFFHKQQNFRTFLSIFTARSANPLCGPYPLRVQPQPNPHQ
ncbi:hypothetical protein, partial [Xylanibacter rodentium]|uniref:hypothetical protein n=1 Tax=Xylanibacter rodentium TaxID=2736289 RepID=UPI00259B6EEB